MNKFNIRSFKLHFVLSILFITACSSTPNQVSSNMTGINVSPVSQIEFKSKHGCFGIINPHAKNEFKFIPCVNDMFVESFKFGFTMGLAKEKLEKINDAVFIDVFNEFKDNNKYLNNCSPTDLIRLGGSPYSVELIYKCEDN
mgnify:CR=1 FL=1